MDESLKNYDIIWQIKDEGQFKNSEYSSVIVELYNDQPGGGQNSANDQSNSEIACDILNVNENELIVLEEESTNKVTNYATSSHDKQGKTSIVGDFQCNRFIQSTISIRDDNEIINDFTTEQLGGDENNLAVETDLKSQFCKSSDSVGLEVCHNELKAVGTTKSKNCATSSDGTQEQRCGRSSKIFVDDENPSSRCNQIVPEDDGDEQNTKAIQVQSEDLEYSELFHPLKRKYTKRMRRKLNLSPEGTVALEKLGFRRRKIRFWDLKKKHETKQRPELKELLQTHFSHLGPGVKFKFYKLDPKTDSSEGKKELFPEEWCCDVCDKSFSSPFELQTHKTSQTCLLESAAL